MNKNSPEEVLVRVGWFVSLQNAADRFEKKPTEENKQMLLGYISSAKEIVKNLIK
jgi:hypothetical protein